MSRLFIIIVCVSFLSACLPTSNNETKSLSDEEKTALLDQALENPKAFQTELKETCAKFSPILLEVAETIHMGSRIWNAGGAPITVRLYNGAAYQILYELDGDCPDLSHVLQAGLKRASERDEINSKGRALRETLDLVMGGPPAKPPGAQ